MNNLDNIWYFDNKEWINFYDIFKNKIDFNCFTFENIISKPDANDNLYFIGLVIFFIILLPIIGLYFLSYFLLIVILNFYDSNIKKD